MSAETETTEFSVLESSGASATHSRFAPGIGLRIAVIGNSGAYGYRLATWLRRVGYNASLITICGKDRHERDRIENIDRDLPAMPTWVAEFDRFDTRFRVLHRDYDVGLTVGPSGLKAVTEIPSLPIVHFVMGSEIHGLATQYRRPTTSLGRWLQGGFYRFFRPPDERRKRGVALHFQRAFDRVGVVLAVHRAMVSAAHDLGLGKKLQSWAFPEDVDGNARRVDQRLRATLHRKYAGNRRVLLWFNRVNLRDPVLPKYKGAELFLEILRQLVDERKHDVRAIVGTHGDDVELFKQRAHDLGVAGSIDYVGHLPFYELLTYLSLDNAIVCGPLNSFGVFEGIVRESTSLGAVSVGVFEESLIERHYGPHCPLALVADAPGYFRVLNDLINLDTAEFRLRQSEILQWAREYLDYSVLIPRLAEILNECVQVPAGVPESRGRPVN